MTREPLVAGPSRPARGAAVLDPLLGQNVFAAAELLHRVLRIALVERPVVALVDRGHWRDVAGAHALESLDEELPVLRASLTVDAGRLAECLEQAISSAQPAADVGADEHLV